MHMEIRLAGEGGQGVILASIVLAEAAIADDFNAVQTQSYGPEARGGASKSEVIIADGDIEYPKVVSPDVLLVLNQVSYDKYHSALKPGGILIVDSTYVTPDPQAEADHQVYQVPITETAREKCGKTVVANMVALGVLGGITGIVSREALIEAALARVPKGTEELNRQALEWGLALAEEAKGCKGAGMALAKRVLAEAETVQA